MEHKGLTPLTTHLFILLGFLSFLIFLLPIFARAPEHSAPLEEDSSSSVTLLFVGDIMLSRQVGKIMEANGWDFPYRLIHDTLSKAHITFGNLETPVSFRGKNQGSIYSFRADPRSLPALHEAGFDVVSVANNHMFDWGIEAFLDTLSHLQEVEIAHSGAGATLSEARKPALLERAGTRFAFLSYSQFAGFRPSEDLPAMAPLDLALIKEDIARAKTQAKVAVVSVHWGNEYETSASLEQKALARALIDAGALLVIGHHPHVVQEVEPYHGGLIAYSLGNFIFDQNFSKDTRTGLMLEVVVKDNTIEHFTPIEIHFTDLFQPEVASEVY